MIRALALALQLLTRLPIPSSSAAPRSEQLGRSVLWFPIVGLLIGALLAGLCLALRRDPGHAGLVHLQAVTCRQPGDHHKNDGDGDENE